ncbi:hypothetical protein PWT90_01343 [Aphanocladium album]|nr:hypothetical protein PWT90_01343 [Aphanocladium album]
MPETDKRAAAQQAVDILHEISTILVRPAPTFTPLWGTKQTDACPAVMCLQNCHLDRKTLSMCISLIERGVNPEALAQVVKELRQEAQLIERDSGRQ